MKDLYVENYTCYFCVKFQLSIINPADLRFMRNGTQKSYAQ